MKLILRAVAPLLLAVALLAGAGVLHGQAPRSGPESLPQRSDSADVAATVERFHRALAAGDSAAALDLLTPDVQVLESGGVEDRAEYRLHHLGADVEFARAVRSSRGPTRVRVHGGVAWATTTSTTQGTFRGRDVNSSGAELMVLVRRPAGWRIAAIHWSSRARRPQG